MLDPVVLHRLRMSTVRPSARAAHVHEAQVVPSRIEEAMNEADRLSHLVEQLLQLARTEGAVLEKTMCDVSDFLKESLKTYSA